MEIANWFSYQAWSTIGVCARYSGWALTAAGLCTTIVGHYAESTSKVLKADRDFKFGRVLDEIDAARLSTSLKQFAGKKYWIVRQTDNYSALTEQNKFATQLDSIFSQGDWIKNDHALVKNGVPIPMPTYIPATDQGLKIGFRDDGPSRALATAIEKLFKEHSVSSQPHTPLSDIESETLLILVGLR